MAKESAFKFSDPELLSLNFKKNEEFKKDKENKPEKIQIKATVEEFPGSRKKFYLSLQVIIDNDGPYIINLVMRSLFDTTDVTDSGQINNFLKVNAPALIFSYIRPFLAYLTSQSGNGTLHLPFYNFLDSDKQLNISHNTGSDPE